MRKYNTYYKFFNVIVGLAILTLTGCSTASESFDSEATKGVGSKSISEVNAMIDQGKIEGIKGDGDGANGELNKVIAPVLVQTPLPNLNPETIVLSDHSVIHRQPEQHMRIWIAPFQDANGNFHEAAVIHTLQRPSFWQVHTIQ